VAFPRFFSGSLESFGEMRDDLSGRLEACLPRDRRVVQMMGRFRHQSEFGKINIGPVRRAVQESGATRRLIWSPGVAAVAAPERMECSRRLARRLGAGLPSGWGPAVEPQFTGRRRLVNEGSCVGLDVHAPVGVAGA